MNLRIAGLQPTALTAWLPRHNNQSPEKDKTLVQCSCPAANRDGDPDFLSFAQGSREVCQLPTDPNFQRQGFFLRKSKPEQEISHRDPPSISNFLSGLTGLTLGSSSISTFIAPLSIAGKKPLFCLHEVRQMKIVEVNAYPLAVPRPGVTSARPDHYLPHWKELSAAGVRANYYACIVEVKTDEGITGYGESLVREVPEAHALIVKKLLGKIIIGQNPERVKELWDIMFSSLCTRGHFGGFFVEALSGVDAALWDILGKAKNKPVYSLLGGPTMEKIKAYASSIYWHYFKKAGPEEVAKEAVRLVEAGHDQIKVKVGASKMGGERDADVKLIRAVRDAIGGEVEIMADANSAFSVEEALKIGKQFEKLEVKWFEEPIPPHDVDGYIKLAKSLDMSIAGGESLFSSYTFRDFITKGGLDIAQPNLSRCGGLTEFLKILKLCESNGVKVAPHVGLSGPGSRAAGLQASAITPRKTFATYEFMYKQDNRLNELVEKSIEIFEKGYLALPREPGLGMKLNHEKLEEFLVKNSHQQLGLQS